MKNNLLTDLLFGLVLLIIGWHFGANSAERNVTNACLKDKVAVIDNDQFVVNGCTISRNKGQ